MLIIGSLAEHMWETKSNPQKSPKVFPKDGVIVGRKIHEEERM